MKLAILIFGDFVILLFFSVFSAFTYPVEELLFCHFDDSVSANLSGLLFIAMAGLSTFIGGTILSIVLLRRSLRRGFNHTKILLRLMFVLLFFPIAWSVFSAIHLYRYCPGFGHTFTPEQEELFKQGSLFIQRA
jgi:hypothetical protein